MKALFDKVSLQASKATTRTYSTSFSLGTSFLGPEVRDAIYAIYGMVRFADEIVDSFHDYDKARLLNKFRNDVHEAIDDRISLNPILNSFQHAVHDYGIERSLIDTFLESMQMDLDKKQYSRTGYEQYILGSAEVVGLMCLRVFVQNNDALYEALRLPAMRLGAAFQKVNFLRDLQADFAGLGRSYFPGINMNTFDNREKRKIEAEIKADFEAGYEGILHLPKNARFGVYMAYIYFYNLFRKIQRTEASEIMKVRIRIPNQHKYAIFLGSYLKHSFNLL